MIRKDPVLDAVFFSLFINNLHASLSSCVWCFLYADDQDRIFWSSSPLVHAATEATQGALIRPKRWFEYWCPPLNPSKCEASSFSVDPYQANLHPNHLLFNSPSASIPLQLYLTFDRTLSFSKHVQYLRLKQVLPRLKAFCCISASSWAPSKESLSLLHKTFPRFLLTYASPGWFPCLSVPTLSNWNAFIKLLVAPSLGASRPLLSLFFYRRRHFFPYESL